MGELLQHAITPINLPVTLILAMVMGYWVTVMLGALDMDSLDIDLDAAPDVDVDLDVDADIEVDPTVDADADVADHGHVFGGGFLHAFLIFVNAHHCPLIIVLSFFSLSLWVLTMLTTIHINPGHSGMMALGLLIPNWIAAILVTKIATMPLVAFFKRLKDDGMLHREVVGQVCTLLTRTDGRRLAQCEVEVGGAPLRFNVKTREGTTIEKGSEAVLVEFVAESGYYMVEPLHTTHQPATGQSNSIEEGSAQ